MKLPFVCLSLFFYALAFTQSTPLVFDGVVGDEEWENAQTFSLDYEVDPGDNSPAPFQTPTLLFLYVTVNPLTP